MTELRRYVKVDEAAEILGVGRDLIYRLTQEGTLPAVKLGARTVIPIRALELVEERALANFDPEAVISALAVGPSPRPDHQQATGVGPSGMAESVTQGPGPLSTAPGSPDQHTCQAVAPKGASVVPLLRAAT